MHIDIVSLFPDIFAALNHGVIEQAFLNKSIELTTWNPRDYTSNLHKPVDDRPYGGGPGMVMLYEPLSKAVEDIKQHRSTIGPVIYLSPQGQPLTQQRVLELSQLPQITLIAGRYEGIDQRFIDHHVDMEVSMGDYVLSGGELPAMTLIDAIARTLPGTLGCSESAQQDSFSNGLLEGPAYTRPATIAGSHVPPVLLSGDHQAIAAWRKQESLRRTWQKRPDLIKRRHLNADEQKIVERLTAEPNPEHEDTKND